MTLDRSFGYGYADLGYDSPETGFGDPITFAGTQVSAGEGRRDQVAVPRGAILEANNNSDPYERREARDYRRISFGTLLLEEYGDFADKSLPLGNRDDSPAHPGVTSPADGRWDEHHQESKQYAKLLVSLDPSEAAKLGVDPDLLLTERETQFCRSFLGFMAVLGHEGSEELTLGNVAPAADQEDAVHSLTEKLSPAYWSPVASRHWADTGESKPLTDSYKYLIRQMAAGKTHGPDLSTVQAYPLHQLNPATWLYLCDDGLIRVKLNATTLVPPAAADNIHAPTCNLAVDFSKPQKPFVQHVTHEYVLPSGLRRTFRAKTYGSGVLAYPAKQRLVDIAGKALVNRSQNAQAAA